MLKAENGNSDPLILNPPLVATLILTHAGQQVFLQHYLIGCDPFKGKINNTLSRLASEILRCHATVK